MSKGIKLTAEQIQHLHDNSGHYGGFREGGETLPGFEKWYICCDEDSGSYDSGKSAMVDFKIYLYGPDSEDSDDGNIMGVAEGGYYYQGDYSFCYDLEFFPEEVEEETKEITEFEGYLVKEMIDFIADMPTGLEPIQRRMNMESEGEEFDEMIQVLKRKL